MKAGLYDCVLASAWSRWARACSAVPAAAPAFPRKVCSGSGTMPSVFAEAGMEHASKYGTTFEQFAKVSVKNHHHSTMNPKAMYQIETPLETVMNAEMISYPNTKLMCSVNVDGSAAAVICLREESQGTGSDGSRREGARFRADLRSLAGT